MVGYANGQSRDTHRIYMYNSREVVETRDVQGTDWDPSLVIAKMPGVLNNPADQEDNENDEKGIME